MGWEKAIPGETEVSRFQDLMLEVHVNRRTNLL